MGLKADALVELAGRAVEEVRQMFKNSTMPVLMDRSVSALRVAVAGIVLFFIYFVAVLLTLQEMDDIRGKAEQVRISAGISRSGRADRIRGERVAEDPGVYSVPNKCRVYLRTGSDRKSLFVFVWLRDRDPGRTAGIGGRDSADSVGSRAAVSEGVEKGCGDLRHLCGLLLSAVRSQRLRLMGKQVGLSPLGSLVSMYVGLKLFGLSGLILGPVGVLLIGDLLRMYEE